MSFRAFLWTVFRRALHGTWGWIEKAEVFLATAIYALSFFFHEIKEWFGVAFLSLLIAGALTLFSGMFWNAYSIFRQVDAERTRLTLQPPLALELDRARA